MLKTPLLAILLGFVIIQSGAGAQDLATRKAQLDQMRKGLANTDEASALVRAYLVLADEAVQMNDFDLAIGASNAASGIAGKLGDAELLNQSRTKEKESSRLKAEWLKIKEAEVKLVASDDPAIHLLAGRYYCFTRDDWPTGIPHLSKGSDTPLKNAALLDLAAKTPEELARAGDEWVAASSVHAAQRSVIVDHALQLFRKVWDQAEGIEREKLRTKFRTLANVPAQATPGGVPSGWNASQVSALNRVFIESNFGHTGRRSLRFEREKETEKGLSTVDSDHYPARPLKEYTLSLWEWSDRNTGERAYVSVAWINADGGVIAFSEVSLTVDVPIWTRVQKSWTSPEGTAKVGVAVGVSYKGRCTVFVDDISLTVDGREVLSNGSFETLGRKP